MYSVISVLVVLIFLSKTFVKCLDTPLDDSYIVNAINTYRNDLVCSNAYQNMRIISSNKQLAEYANELMYNQTAPYMNASILHITSKTCSYSYTHLARDSLKTNVERFIQKCIHKTTQTGNSMVSWLKNPQYTKIGCAYSLSGVHFVLCVLGKTESETADLYAIPKTDNSKLETNMWKQNGALFINKCLRLERPNYKSCYLLTSTRDYIQNEVNRYRKTLVHENEYDDLVEVKWDKALEMSVIELSKFSPIWTDDCFTVASHSSGFEIQEFTPNPNFLLEPKLNPEIIQFIADSDKLIRDLYAIGCTYFKADQKAILLCMWNKDQTIMSTVKYWTRIVHRYLIANPYLVYVIIGVVIFNVVIIILYIKVVRHFKSKKSLRRATVVESIYSKAM